MRQTRVGKLFLLPTFLINFLAAESLRALASSIILFKEILFIFSKNLIQLDRNRIFTTKVESNLSPFIYFTYFIKDGDNNRSASQNVCNAPDLLSATFLYIISSTYYLLTILKWISIQGSVIL